MIGGIEMRTIPKEESLDIEFKSDLKCYPDHDLIEEIVGMTNTAGDVYSLALKMMEQLPVFIKNIETL